MDNILNNYRIKLEEETKYKIPLFDKLSTHQAKILAVLQDPGNSGAEKVEHVLLIIMIQQHPNKRKF